MPQKDRQAITLYDYIQKRMEEKAELNKFALDTNPTELLSAPLQVKIAEEGMQRAPTLQERLAQEKKDTEMT